MNAFDERLRELEKAVAALAMMQLDGAAREQWIEKGILPPEDAMRHAASRRNALKNFMCHWAAMAESEQE